MLLAARAVFAEVGYDAAGIREIAAQAGVDARLVGRYFGSKEGLFAEVVAVSFDKTLPMGSGHNHDAALSLLGAQSDEPSEAMLITLRSASNERATAIIRDNLESRYQRVVADGLDGRDAIGRAALMVAICSGVWLQRDVVGNTALTGATARELAPYLEAALDAISATPPPKRRGTSPAKRSTR